MKAMKRRAMKKSVIAKGKRGKSSHEGHEGHEGHEKACHEEERHRQGQAREEQRLQGQQGEDCRWSHEGCSDEEQERQGCEQEGQRKWQEELQEDLWLDHCFQGSKEGIGNQGFLPMWRQDCQGQGTPCKDSCPLQEVKC